MITCNAHGKNGSNEQDSMRLQTKKVQIKTPSKDINKTDTVNHSEVTNNLSDINSAKVRVVEGSRDKANLDC